MNKYLISLSLAISIGQIPSNSVAQSLNDCSCITAAATDSAAGVVTSVSGDVLVDGISAESNKIIQIGSHILVGQGATNISVGQSCYLSVSANSEVLITQPGGANSNICVQSHSNAAIANTQNTFAATSPTVPGLGLIAGVAVIGGGIALIASSSDDDGSPSGSNNKNRPAVSN